MAYIYKIVNDINNKIYIGQTIFDIEKRFKNHKKDTKNRDNSKLHSAMIKYGTEHFKIEIVEECEREKLDEREIYWIKYFDCVKKGYNTTHGGLGDTKISKEEQEKWCEEYKSGKTTKKIAAEFKRDIGTVRDYVSGMKDYAIYKKKHYANANTKNKNKYMNVSGKRVVQFDLDGNFLKSFCSVREASRAMKKTPSSIRHSCLTNGTAGNYQWRYEEDWLNGNIPTKKIVYGTRKVYQYNKEMVLLNVYKNQIEAAKLNNFKQSVIWSCLNNKAKTAYGYIWRYE